MEFFPWIFKILNAKMQAPRAFGFFHLSFFALSIMLGILLCRAKGEKGEKYVKRVLLITSLAVMVLEIYKQVVFSFTYVDGQVRFSYAWRFFPFQFCSTPMYAGFIAGITGNKRLHHTLCAFLATYSFAAGLGVMLFPSAVFTDIIGINIQTMVCHGSMLTLGIFLLFTGYVTGDKKTFLRAMPVFLLCVLTAAVLNEIVFKSGILGGETFNMFFISPYFKASLPIYSYILKLLPFPLGVILYALLFTLGAYTVLFIASLLTPYVLKKMKIRDILTIK